MVRPIKCVEQKTSPSHDKANQVYSRAPKGLLSAKMIPIKYVELAKDFYQTR